MIITIQGHHDVTIETWKDMPCWLKEIKDHSSTVMCDDIVLIAVVILEMLPGKWH